MRPSHIFINNSLANRNSSTYAETPHIHTFLGRGENKTENGPTAAQRELREFIPIQCLLTKSHQLFIG